MCYNRFTIQIDLFKYKRFKMEGVPKKILGRATLKKDVFETSVLRFFIVSFKRCYDEYLLWFFFTIVEV